jgi:hypothetical protein
VKAQEGAMNIRHTVARMKERIEHKYVDAAAEHGGVVRLSLNEAEALAWQTEHPHLFFPLLAEEKAQAALSWHYRQRAVRQRTGEVAFAA